MANVKITELTAATALAGTDVLPIVDVGADATKKVSVSDLLRNLPDGTATAPALAFADDQNTGVLSPAANELAFTTSGTQRLVIDSSGNVGIGVSSPAAKLEVQGAATSSAIAAHIKAGDGGSTVGLIVDGDSEAGDVLLKARSNNSASPSDSDTKFIIQGDGKVGIGTSSPSTKFHLTGNDSNEFITLAHATRTGSWIIRHSGTNSENLEFQQNNGSTTVRSYLAGRDVHEFHTNGSERLRIDSSGRVGIGTSSPAQKLDVNGSIKASGNATIGATTGNAFIELGAGATENRTAFMDFVGDTTYSDYGLRVQRDAGGANTQSQLLHRGTGDFRLIAQEAAPIEFWTSNTERMRIDSSGNVGVGTTSNYDDSALEVRKTAGGDGVAIRVTNNTTTDGSQSGIIFTTSTSDFTSAAIAHKRNDNALIFYNGQSSGGGGFANATERMRIGSDGAVYIGKSSSSFSVDGHYFNSTGYYALTRTSGTPLFVTRNGTDGTLVSFSAQNVNEGTISVSGTTVSYNGAHLSRWSQLPSGAIREEIFRGSVLSNIDEMCEWGDEDNEQLNRMQVSDVEGDRNVAGVFQAWDDDDDTYTNDFYCAMTGDFVIRIAQGTTVARGDLLMSAGDGTAKPQDDDIVRSKTIAKVTSTTVSTTYADGSYCVPCVLMAC